MPKRAYQDFDEFADSIAGIAGRFVPTKPSIDPWWVQQVHAGRLSLQQVHIGGAATFAGDGQAACLTIGVPMTDPRLIHIDGGPLDKDTVLFLKDQQPFTFASRNPSLWAGITLPLEHFLLGDALNEGPDAQATGRSNMRMMDVARLRELTARLSGSDRSVSVADPAAATSAEEEIAICVAQAVEHSVQIRELHKGRFYHSRARVIRRSLELIEASAGLPLHVVDLCKASEVSERTLRSIFNDFFGVSPMRLIKLRQLREIQAALASADPERDTVRLIAQRFGVWDFSLFSRNYKKLFNAHPSETLRAPPPDRGEARVKVSWLECVTPTFNRRDRPPLPDNDRQLP